ncbi:MAG: 4Fe-4S ferredoxin [Oscillatoriales cyanobacterium RM2_1_1]|nr:4Fe-4S ferredoxin [Oscillatoriales cyanobacterium SM2_3_0]NJO47524.1 4Fe-4S ferredoxin [Oscillatoriales cyanobacterium RM2_1_1]
MTINAFPLNSLDDGNWFKLICGASYQHLPAVRSLVLAYTLAGADCIDVAADPAVIAAAQEAFRVAQTLGDQAQRLGFDFKGKPLLMVSVNDGEDPHFRKAEFDPAACPPDCWRPCEQVCPAGAIAFSHPVGSADGVIDQLCYGCGRCLPACPSQLIQTRSFVSAPASVMPLVLQMEVDAIEIHTQVGRDKDFRRLWNWVQPWVNQLKLVAISCPDGPDWLEYLQTLHQIISPLPCPLIWQVDGRPMSGDIGMGTTIATIRLAEKLLGASEFGLSGYVQLAGGTNGYTVAKLRSLNLLAHSKIDKGYSRTVAGVAYGSYARTLLSAILDALESTSSSGLGSNLISESKSEILNISRVAPLETEPTLLWQAVGLAHSLISQIKSSVKQEDELPVYS